MRENVPLLPKEICPGIHLHKHSHTKARSYTAVCGYRGSTYRECMYTLVFVLLYCTCLTFLQHWVLVVFYVQVQVINITIPTHLDFTNGAYEYSTDNGTVHLANMIKFTTTTNPCCPLPREACALEACPHLAWRTLATAWQQLLLSWPSPMLPHLSPHNVRNNQFFFSTR